MLFQIITTTPRAATAPHGRPCPPLKSLRPSVQTPNGVRTPWRRGNRSRRRSRHMGPRMRPPDTSSARLRSRAATRATHESVGPIRGAPDFPVLVDEQPRRVTRTPTGGRRQLRQHPGVARTRRRFELGVRLVTDSAGQAGDRNARASAPRERRVPTLEQDQPTRFPRFEPDRDRRRTRTGSR